MKVQISEKIIIYRFIKIISTFCNYVPSDVTVEIYLHGYDDKCFLQEAVLKYLKPEYDFATGDSILSAAESIAHSQIYNGLEEVV